MFGEKMGGDSGMEMNVAKSQIDKENGLSERMERNRERGERILRILGEESAEGKKLLQEYESNFKAYLDRAKDWAQRAAEMLVERGETDLYRQYILNMNKDIAEVEDFLKKQEEMAKRVEYGRHFEAARERIAVDTKKKSEMDRQVDDIIAEVKEWGDAPKSADLDKEVDEIVDEVKAWGKTPEDDSKRWRRTREDNLKKWRETHEDEFKKLRKAREDELKKWGETPEDEEAIPKAPAEAPADEPEKKEGEASIEKADGEPEKSTEVPAFEADEKKTDEKAGDEVEGSEGEKPEEISRRWGREKDRIRIDFDKKKWLEGLSEKEIDERLTVLYNNGKISSDGISLDDYLELSKSKKIAVIANVGKAKEDMEDVFGGEDEEEEKRKGILARVKNWMKGGEGQKFKARVLLSVGILSILGGAYGASSGNGNKKGTDAERLASVEPAKQVEAATVANMMGASETRDFTVDFSEDMMPESGEEEADVPVDLSGVEAKSDEKTWAEVWGDVDTSAMDPYDAEKDVTKFATGNQYNISKSPIRTESAEVMVDELAESIAGSNDLAVLYGVLLGLPGFEGMGYEDIKPMAEYMEAHEEIAVGMRKEVSDYVDEMGNREGTTLEHVVSGNFQSQEYLGRGGDIVATSRDIVEDWGLDSMYLVWNLTDAEKENIARVNGFNMDEMEENGGRFATYGLCSQLGKLVFSGGRVETPASVEEGNIPEPEPTPTPEPEPTPTPEPEPEVSPAPKNPENIVESFENIGRTTPGVEEGGQEILGTTPGGVTEEPGTPEWGPEGSNVPTIENREAETGERLTETTPPEDDDFIRYVERFNNAR